MPAPSVVAVDIGGTGIKAARVLLDGRLEGRCTVPTPVGRGPAAVVATVAEVARRLVTPSTLGVGVCVPGLVDAPAAVVRYAPNLGMRDLPLGTLLAAELALPVVMEHDVRAATLAELRLGLGVGADDLLLVALGTGIAAGLVVGGTVAAGATASAGELGHLPVHVGGEPCACGQRGCLEVYASAGGLVRRYRAAGGSPAMSAADLAAAVGVDPLAARVWDDGVRSLGHGLVCATLLLAPALLVLAGGLSLAGERLADPVRAHLAAGLAWREPPPLRLSPLGAHAGLYGAALLAMDAAGHRGSTASWALPAPSVA
ncbi:MAG TPA: ROK family protein [Actinomycetales bacterium]